MDARRNSKKKSNYVPPFEFGEVARRASLKQRRMRSAIMRAVKSRDTSPERVVRKLLSENGYRYRLHSKKLAGTPDIVFPGRKKAIFIHGCFWHGHPCKRGARVPKTNRKYWIEKVARNKKRDAKQRKILKSAGWNVLVVWECKTKDLGRLRTTLCEFLNRDSSAA